MDSAALIAEITENDLLPPVRRLIGHPAARLVEWRVSPLSPGLGNPVSLGLYRLSGTAVDGLQPYPFSLVLKAIQSPANLGLSGFGEGDDLSHWNYWKREYHIYQSGLLTGLPAGVCAPRCYGLVSRPGDVCWMWIEEIRDEYNGQWPLERYRLAARHLGRFNGRYLCEAPLPDVNWLSRRQTRQWVDSIGGWQPAIFDPGQQPNPWQMEHIAGRYPGAEQNPFRRLVDNHEAYLQALERLPLTLCHGDTYPTNLMARRDIDGNPETVLVDLALMTLDPPGLDLSQLAFGVWLRHLDLDLDWVERALFEDYLAGLDDAGCRVEPYQVRFAFTASAALRIGLFQLLMASQPESETEPEESRPPEPRLEECAACFEAYMAEQADRLLAAVG